MPGRWISAGRAQRFLRKPGKRRCRLNAPDDDPGQGAALSRRGAAAISTTSIRWRAICCATPTDAEDAVQECYLRALKHFDSYRGPAMKPWLFAILRNVCRAEFARRASSPTDADRRLARERRAGAAVAARHRKRRKRRCCASRDAGTIRRLVDALAEPFRETFVLREINNLSYREIADAVGAPVGTVMSRLARARAMLRSAWMAEQEQPK